MHTSGSTSDTPVGASLLFDPLRVIARPACQRTDMGFAVRGTLVWANQLRNYVRLLVQGTGGRCAIHVVADSPFIFSLVLGFVVSELEGHDGNTTRHATRRGGQLRPNKDESQLT